MNLVPTLRQWKRERNRARLAEHESARTADMIDGLKGLKNKKEMVVFV